MNLLSYPMIGPLRLLHQLFSKDPDLTELDVLYQKAISGLSVCSKRDYCQRLVHRVEFELKDAKCRKEILRLRTLRRAAKKKIYELNVCVERTDIES